MRHGRLFLAAALFWTTHSLPAQLLEHLRSITLDKRLPVGDPALTPPDEADGPKSIAAGDFDQDGQPDLAVANKDGSVTVYFGRGEDSKGKARFSKPVHLHAGTNELRDLVAADLFGAGRLDLAVTSPRQGRLYLLENLGSRRWSGPRSLPTWPGARDLAAGDFDGDGRTDLVVAGSTNGLWQLRGHGRGIFSPVVRLTSVAVTNFDAVQPAFYLKALRWPGAIRSELLVGRANFEGERGLGLQLFRAGPSGALEFRAALSNLHFNAFALGPVLTPAETGVPDLVLTDNDAGTVTIRRGVPTKPTRFAGEDALVLQPGGGVRTAQIVDFDGDGWNDVAVVLSAMEQVLIYRNHHGQLRPWQELPTGGRPREMVVRDFNGDHRPDLAVLNRTSQDVSVLLNRPPRVPPPTTSPPEDPPVDPSSLPGEMVSSFGTMNMFYRVDGEPVALKVRDLNRDGRDDVVQLHRLAGSMSVRLANADGSLGPAVSYTMNVNPSDLALRDLNRDGHVDALVAGLSGAIVARLGTGTGSFGAAIVTALPAEHQGSLFTVFPTDLDNDGIVDVAAGFFDCRLALFRGTGTGRFSFCSVQPYSYESHAMTAADFDQDGDLDLVALGYYGVATALVNRGDLLATTNFHKVETTVPEMYGVEAASTGDFDGDPWPDLLVTGHSGVQVVHGGPDMQFHSGPNDRVIGASAASFALADVDGDGTNDLVLGRMGRPGLIVLKGLSGGRFGSAFEATVPSSTLVSAGDLDGDGKPDLVGTGGVLWTVLSSRAPGRAPASTPGSTGAKPAPGVFINELLAENSGRPLAADGNRESDWVEIFNAAGSTNVGGWQLKLEKTNFVVNISGGTTQLLAQIITNVYRFPDGTLLSNGAHLILVCSEKTRRSPFHTGFTLPAGPATLRLCDKSGATVDRIKYPAQPENRSYRRYRDGLPGWAASRNPSPGLANVDDGPVPPSVELEGVDGDVLEPNVPLRFLVRAHDDLGVRSVSVIWRRLDEPDTQNHRVLLFDDGMNGDGALGDGLHAGLLDPGLPDGAAIGFYVECTDISGEATTSPDEPEFNASNWHTLAIATAVPSLEISELVADNGTGLSDEGGGRPGWVEVRNTSTDGVSLAGVQVARKFFGKNSRFTFPKDQVLAAGEHLVLFADGKPGQGPFHLPFSLSDGGGELWLTGMNTQGARTRIDSVRFGPQRADIAWARLGAGGPWHSAPPTPRTANLAGLWQGLTQLNQFTFAFATERNQTYQVEFTDALDGSIWTRLPPMAGSGVELSITQPLAAARFYRVRIEE